MKLAFVLTLNIEGNASPEGLATFIEDAILSAREHLLVKLLAVKARQLKVEAQKLLGDTVTDE